MSIRTIFRALPPREPPPPPAAPAVRVGPVPTPETLDRYAAAYTIGCQLIRAAKPLLLPWDDARGVA